MDQLIQSIKETQVLLLDKINLDFKRSLFNKIDFSSQLIGIVGSRGVGKTTLILQYLKERQASNSSFLYFSADNVLFEKGDMLLLARDFYLKHAGRLICIDEIHKYPNWSQEIKNIYDSFPDLKVIFSGSSSLNLVHGKYDLSRRGILYALPGLSFREYLEYIKELKLDPVTIDEIVAQPVEVLGRIGAENQILKHFRDYLKQGYYPFFNEVNSIEPFYQQLVNSIDKSIYEDISSFYQLKTQNLFVFKKILHFLSTTKPGEINTHKLSNSLKKNYDTVSNYLEILHNTKLIRFLTNDRAGHAFIRNAKKVFLENTTMMYALNSFLGKDNSIGTLRELFLLTHIQNSGIVPLYTNKGDIKINDITFEVGGKNKDASQIQGIPNSFLVLDDVIVASKNTIPLYLFGFLY